MQDHFVERMGLRSLRAWSHKVYRVLASIVVLQLLSWNLQPQQGLQAQSVSTCGECAITESRTLADAKACAFQVAMENALREAGIERSVVGTSALQSLQTSEEHALSTFIEASTISWRGGIRGTKDENETTRIDELGDVVVSHCATFDVWPYSTLSDPGFQFTINGLQNVYPDNAELTFNVKGPSGCLQAFLLEGDQVYRFFPNDSETASCLPENFDDVQFPAPASQRSYELFHEPGIDGPWLLAFVFTKKDRSPAVPATWTARELLFWIDSMEPAERCVRMHPFAFGS